MTRREILTAGVASLVLMTAGCGGFGWMSPTPTQADEPTAISEPNVVEFATQHATATLNEGYPGNDIDCDGALHTRAAAGTSTGIHLREQGFGRPPADHQAPAIQFLKYDA